MSTLTFHKLQMPDFTPFWSLLAEIECGDHFDVAKSVHQDWLQSKIQSRIHNNTFYYAADSEHDKAVGILGLQLNTSLFSTPTAEIVDIGIFPQYRRKGLGSQMLEYAIALAKSFGVPELFVRTYAADSHTIYFYGKNHFFPVAVIPGTNGPLDEGNIVMRYKLPLI